MGALNFFEEEVETAALTVASPAGIISPARAKPLANTEAARCRLTDKQRAVAAERWRYCRDVVDLMRQTGRGMEVCAELVARRDAVRYQYLKVEKLHYHNCRNWLGKLGVVRGKNGRDYDWNNVAALADKYTCGRQKLRFDEICLKIFCAAYFSPRQVPFTVAYREVKNLFAREFKEVRFPSEQQLRYEVDHLSQNLVDSMRYGIDYVENRSLYMMIRDWDRIRPGQCWFADTRTFDQLVRIDNGDGTWRAVRPNVTFIMDASSWFCVGFDCWEESVNSDLIRNTFARACFEHGMPEFFYVDNGADFNKRGFTTPVMVGGKPYSIVQSLGVRLVNSKPYKGRSKTVERRFLIDAMDFDRRAAAYVGNSPGTRPDEVELYYKGDNIMLLPTIWEFKVALQAEIDKFHRRPMGGHLKGKSPLEVFDGSDRLRRAPMDERDMYLAMLLPEGDRKVHRGGCIDYNRIRYYADELFHFTGQKIMIKTTYLEPGSVHAYTLDGKYITECTAQAMTHPLAHYLGDDDEKRELDEQTLIQGRQRKKLLEQRKEITNGLYGLSLDEITTLSRSQLEGQIKLVQLGEVRKVKGHNHNVKLLATAERAATARALAEENRAGTTGGDCTAADATKEPSIPSIIDAEPVDPAAISNVHKFITNRRKNDDY